MEMALALSVRVPQPAATAKPREITDSNPGTPAASPGARVAGLLVRILRILAKNTRGVILDVLYGTGGGGSIDDSAMPSGFAVPYKKGSRQVRNLWHEPF
jgi:hypothetical protein